MSNLPLSNPSSKSLSSEKDCLIQRYRKEFNIHEAHRFIESVESLGEFKLKPKHAHLLAVLLHRYKYGIPILDDRQQNCFPSMRLIKVAMKYVADNKNTTPDVARRDLENNGFLEVTRNLRFEDKKNANNLFRLTEKFFLYYALFRVKHEKTILVGQKEEDDYFKNLEAAESLIKIRIEKINRITPQVEPVEKILGTLGALKKKLKAVNEEISEKVINGESINKKLIAQRKSIQLDIGSVSDKLKDNSAHKRPKHITNIRRSKGLKRGDVNKQPLNNKKTQPIPLEKHNPYPCPDTTQTIHNHNDSYLTSNPPPSTPPQSEDSQESQNPKSVGEEGIKKIIKLFQDKRGITQGKKQQKSLVEKMGENATSLEQVRKNILFLMDHPIGKYTTKYVSRAGIPFSSLSDAMDDDVHKLREHRQRTGLLRTSPLLFSQFGSEVAAIEALAPNEFKSLVDRLNQEVDEKIRVEFVRTLEDEDFFSGNYGDKFQRWVAEKYPGEQQKIEAHKKARAYNKLLWVLEDSMKKVHHRYDGELAKQVANDYLDIFLNNDSFLDGVDAGWWYETWVKENKPEIFSRWKEEEEEEGFIEKRTCVLEEYLSNKPQEQEGRSYAQDF